MSNEVWLDDVLDGFTEVDEQGVPHQVVWEEYEVMPDVSYEVWLCKTHNQPYYGKCIKDMDK